MKVAFLFYICLIIFWAFTVLSVISFLLQVVKKDVTSITNAQDTNINQKLSLRGDLLLRLMD